MTKCSACGVHSAYPEVQHSILQGGNFLRRCNVASHTADEHVTKALVKHNFCWHTGVGAAQDCCLWLLACGESLDAFEVLMRMCAVAVDKAKVALHQALHYFTGLHSLFQAGNLEKAFVQSSIA